MYFDRPVGKERQLLRMRTRDACANSGERSSLLSLSLSRSSLPEKRSRNRRTRMDRFLSLPRRPSHVNNGSTGESYHAACLVYSAASSCPHFGDRSARIVVEKFISSIDDSPTTFTTPLAGNPFRRADRPFVFLVLATRRVAQCSRHFFIGCPSSYEPQTPFHLTHGSLHSSPRDNLRGPMMLVARSYTRRYERE